ncbi:MAG TPA: hypothetical protein VNU68_07075 [Verrucomicrobiae bacterium]|nr:hypothetical protein [Verrucomicrobiae bacterium]
MKKTLKESPGVTALSLLLPCLLLGLPAGCKTSPPTAALLQRLQGTWEEVKADGTNTVTVTGNSFYFHRDSNFWWETSITLPAGTEPQQLRATIRHSAPPEDSNGKVVVAIFKIEDGTLTVGARGDGSEETPKSFEDAKVTRYELRKVQPQKKNTELPKSK